MIDDIRSESFDSLSGFWGDFRAAAKVLRRQFHLTGQLRRAALFPRPIGRTSEHDVAAVEQVFGEKTAGEADNSGNQGEWSHGLGVMEINRRAFPLFPGAGENKSRLAATARRFTGVPLVYGGSAARITFKRPYPVHPTRPGGKKTWATRFRRLTSVVASQLSSSRSCHGVRQ